MKRSRSRRDQGCDHRPAERREVDSAERAVRAGAGDRLAGRGNDARCGGRDRDQDGVEYIFVDTAGIRRKGKTKEMTEKLSVVMARRNIRMANVVLLVIDATKVCSDTTRRSPDTRTKRAGR